jgi:hypothetical protein
LLGKIEEFLKSYSKKLSFVSILFTFIDQFFLNKKWKKLKSKKQQNFRSGRQRPWRALRLDVMI